MKGGSVSVDVGMKIMLYTYCTTFSINPAVAYDTPATLIKEMLEIHSEVKTMEQEAMEQARKKA